MSRRVNRCLKCNIAVGCCLILLSVFNMAGAVTIDHNHTDITQIPQSAIEQAKTRLHIAYGHTSHGSQLITGMIGLVNFANNGGLGLNLPDNIFAWNNGGTDGALDLHDGAMGGDVGYYPQWINYTRAYLDDPANADVNVIIWSWCGQVDAKYADGTLESEYLDPMVQLENDYPNVTFVYMTGHVDIGDDTNNKAANQMIRNFCETNNKVLYDFADIERYNPDGNYFEFVNDNCNYYDRAGGSVQGNWATEWQNSHTEGVDWYNCGSTHSEALNANRKAYAAWWLWAVLGGWNPTGANRAPVLTAIGSQNAVFDQQLQFTVSASDLDSGDALTYAVDTLPDGASFDTASGVFQWTPTTSQMGDHTIVFSVRDNGSPQAGDQETVTISVTDSTGPGNNSNSGNSSGGGCFLDALFFDITPTRLLQP